MRLYLPFYLHETHYISIDGEIKLMKYPHESPYFLVPYAIMQSRDIQKNAPKKTNIDVEKQLVIRSFSR